MIFIFGSLFLGQDELPLEMLEGAECLKINCVWYAFKHENKNITKTENKNITKN